MPRYRLLSGAHSEGEAFDPELKRNEPLVFRKGDVFDSASDLEKHNRPYAVKFERVPDSTPLTPLRTVRQYAQGKSAQLAAPTPPETPSKPAAQLPDTLDGMSLEDLRRFAAEEEIDVGRAKSKAELLAAIRAAR